MTFTYTSAKRWMLAAISVLFFASSAFSQTARVQVIHNAADPGAASVDIYLDDTLTLDNFGFRDATPFIDFTAGSEVVIGVAGPESASSADAIATFPVTIEGSETYVVVANGVLDPSTFAVNPDGISTAFGLIVQPMGQEESTDPEEVQFFAVHGATDAPTVDVVALGVATLVDDAPYGAYTPYQGVPAGSYTLDVTPGSDNGTVVASFEADLSTLAGGAAAVIASGFLDPTMNQDGPAFGLIAVLPDGMVIELPSVATTASETDAVLPSRFDLLGNYQNPFNPTTNVVLNLAQASDVSVAVFDVAGKRVMDIAAGTLAAGQNTIPLNASSLPSGTYLYQVTAGTGANKISRSGKMLLAK